MLLIQSFSLFNLPHQNQFLPWSWFFSQVLIVIEIDKKQ
ncbi:hypothetical protein LPE509_02754 [Legionella pneumophila subsp. pneumophila LPE509]|nr:hypothetical protein LPE509_02754 [Legionella pneumophila subsp. pneumophila LPE509]